MPRNSRKLLRILVEIVLRLGNNQIQLFCFYPISFVAWDQCCADVVNMFLYGDLISFDLFCCYRGTDVSAENMHQGFTHIFESSFESTEGVAEYVAHPAHVDFANVFLPQVEKVIVVDYKPTTLRT